MTEDGDDSSIRQDDPDLLGTGELDSDIASKYAERRRMAAINVLGELSAKSEEFERRQSEVNGSFLRDLADHLPTAKLSYQVERYKPSVLFNDVEAWYGANISSLWSEIDFDVADQSLNEVNGEILSSISAARASTIWINSKRDQVIEADLQAALGNPHSTHSKVKIDDEIILPYVIVGQRDSSGSVDVLFMPLLPESGHDRASLAYDRNPEKKLIFARVAVAEKHFSDIVMMSWKSTLLKATMRQDELKELLNLQETLYDLGVKPEEIEAIHDAESGIFKLNPRQIQLIRAGETSGLNLVRRIPDNVPQLLEHRFALSHTRFISSALSPLEFRDFDVLKHAQRAAAMLGRSEAFDSAKDKLVKKSLADPNGKWFDDTTGTAFNPTFS